MPDPHTLQVIYQRAQSHETNHPYRQPSIGYIRCCHSLKDDRASREVRPGGIHDDTAGRCDGMTGECTVVDGQAHRIRGWRNGCVAYDNFGCYIFRVSLAI